MLSDCLKCSEHFCFCGYEYKDWSDEKRIEIILAILQKTKSDKLKKIREELK